MSIFTQSNYKKIFFVILFLLSILSVIWLASLKGNKKSGPLPTIIGAPVESFKGITPGLSNKAEVIQTLGEPIKTTDLGQQTKLDYPSNKPTRNSEVYLQDQTAVFVKEIVSSKDKKKPSDLTKKFGEPKYFLFGPASTSGLNLYVFPDRGIAFVANIEADYLFEIWYFPPTDYSTFKNTYAQDYSETFKPIQ